MYGSFHRLDLRFCFSSFSGRTFHRPRLHWRWWGCVILLYRWLMRVCFISEKSFLLLWRRNSMQVLRSWSNSSLGPGCSLSSDFSIAIASRFANSVSSHDVTREAHLQPEKLHQSSGRQTKWPNCVFLTLRILKNTKTIIWYYAPPGDNV